MAEHRHSLSMGNRSNAASAVSSPVKRDDDTKPLFSFSSSSAAASASDNDHDPDSRPKKNFYRSSDTIRKEGHIDTTRKEHQEQRNSRVKTKRLNPEQMVKTRTRLPPSWLKEYVY